VSFAVPLLWALNTPGQIQNAVNRFNGYVLDAAGPETSTVSMGRQRIGVAPADGDYATLEVDVMQFNVAFGPAGAGTAFYPYVTVMRGACEVLRHLAGVAPAQSDAHFRYHADYATLPLPSPMTSTVLTSTGLPHDGNALKQMVLEIITKPTSPADPGTPQPVSLGFQGASGGKGGGLVQPNTAIAGLSRGLGASPALPTETFDPSSYFGDAGKLFGLIPITALIPDGTPLDRAPRFVTEGMHAAERYYTESQRLADALDSLPQQAKDAVFAKRAVLDAALANITRAVQNITDPATTSDALSKLQTAFDPTQNPVPIVAALNDLIAFLSDDGNFMGPNGLPIATGMRRGVIVQANKLLAAANLGFDRIAKAIAGIQHGLDIVRDLKCKIEWRPDISLDQGSGADAHRDVPSAGTLGAGLLTLKQANPLFLSVEVNGQAHDANSGTTIFASLDDFYLNFPPGYDNACVQLKFDRIFFSKKPNEKAEIDVNLHDIVFAQQLSFIQDIRKAIPLDGFSDPPHIDVDESGIHASFSVGLPNLPFGIVCIENLTISAGLDVPFVGDGITFRFSFGDRDHPFTATVAMLGGGGYFMLELLGSASGVAFKRLEASIEVCAQISIDIGVASGNVSISAGFIFAYDKNTGCSLTGFVDIRGGVNVIGMINVSIEARMELTYNFSDNSVLGSCSLTVDVEVLFFSASVSLHFEKRFGGCGDHQVANAARRMHTELATAAPALPPPPPAFSDLISPEVWSNEYVVAFA
jgi:hypothetical protein